MRRVAILVVALMVVFAGCSTGGNGGDGTASPTSSPETTEEADTPDDSDSTSDEDTDDETDSDLEDSPNVSAALSSSGSFSGHTKFEMTIHNRSEQISLTIINDTEEQLYVVNQSSMSGATTFYVTDGPDAYRNTTSGETRYGTGDSRIESSAGFTALLAVAGFAYVGVMDWEKSRTTTVDGSEAYVFEADSINRSALDTDKSGLTLEADNVESATGRLVIDSDGRLRSAHVRITTPEGTSGVDLTIETGDDITVEKPDWIDDSQFGS